MGVVVLGLARGDVLGAEDGRLEPLEAPQRGAVVPVAERAVELALRRGKQGFDLVHLHAGVGMLNLVHS